MPTGSPLRRSRRPYRLEHCYRAVTPGNLHLCGSDAEVDRCRNQLPGVRWNLIRAGSVLEAVVGGGKPPDHPAVRVHLRDQVRRVLCAREEELQKKLVSPGLDKRLRRTHPRTQALLAPGQDRESPGLAAGGVVLRDLDQLLPVIRGGGMTFGFARVPIPAVVFAATNSIVEEGIYRFSVTSIFLENGLSARSAAISSGLLFGGVHYSGMPGGIPGVFLAGFLGWLLSKSIAETKSIGWAWLIHFVQDVVIFVAIFGTQLE
jgi:hypothetical protein